MWDDDMDAKGKRWFLESQGLPKQHALRRLGKARLQGGGMMWIFASGGFLSIVAHRYKPNHVLVRARNMDHLENIFPNVSNFSLENSDYPHRAVVTRTDVCKVISDYIMGMQYDNFKNSIIESRYHSICHDVWSLMYEYGLPFREVV